MDRIRAELLFLRTLLGVNLASAMEYRVSFISQAIGMLVNDGVYFLFWLIFFERFGTVRGYEVQDVYLLFAIVTMGYGLGYTLAGNTGPNLAYLIAQGRLDYYLVFPRHLLLHVICSRMAVSAIGDMTFGVLAFLFAGRLTLFDILLYTVVVILVALIMVAFAVVTGSLAFYMGNAQYISQQMNNSFLTFALYPNTLFSGTVRLLLFTLLPAGFVGAVPVAIVRNQNLWLLTGLTAVTTAAWALALFVFYTGLRRYESGSAINVNV